MRDLSADSASVLPCKRCGAPTAEVPSPSAQRHVVMRCSFCGHDELLPLEAAARVKALQRRLKEIGWLREAREAPAIAFISRDKGFESTRRMGVTFVASTAVAFAALALVLAFTEGVGLAAFVFVVPTSVVSTVFGHLVFTAKARHDLANELRPSLEAVPPRVGAALGCRVCGAPLTLTSDEGAFVVCAFCAAPNLIGRSDAEHQAELLAAQLETWRAASRGELSRYQIAIGRYATRLNLATLALVAAFVVLMMTCLAGPSLFMH